MPVWNVRDGFVWAQAGFGARAVDSALSGAERALAGEAANACGRGINALGQDDLWPQGQREARWTDCLDKAKSLNTVETAHGVGNPRWMYDYIDIMVDSAKAARRALTTFVSSVVP